MRKKAIESTKTWNKDLKGGETLEGRFIKTEVVTGQYGDNEKYIIETNDGQLYGVYATASLSRQFANIPEGSLVWITYKGVETSKNGRNVKVYDVEYDDEA